MKNIDKTAIQKTIADMTVADMRKAAKEFGIKNAKQYKRPELFEKLFAAMVARAEADAAQDAAKKSQKGMHKAPKGSNRKVEDDVAEAVEYLNGKAHGDDAGSIETNLLTYGRQVLIRIMTMYKIKGWYRIYNKYTMAAKIAEQVAA